MKADFSYFNYSQVNKTSIQRNTAFGHHRDFNKLAERLPILTSHYFRRGLVVYINNFEKFGDIINVFKNVFTNNIQKPVKMLIAGVANSEEPFSYLTSIKTIIKDKPIDDVLDLHIIDLQSKPDENKLYENSYIPCNIPEFAKDGFVYCPHPKYPSYNYRVTDELFDYLAKVYNDSSKSKWETRLQEEIINYPDNYFDIISANNILYYLENGENFQTYNNMCDKVNSGGYIITESDNYAFNYRNMNHFIHFKDGIYKRIKYNPIPNQVSELLQL